MVRNENYNGYFKSKGFYVSLLLSVIAIVAIGVFCFQLSPANQNNDVADINEPLAKKEPSLNNAENIDSAKQDIPKVTSEPVNLLENDIVDDNSTSDFVAMTDDNTEEVAEVEVNENQATADIEHSDTDVAAVEQPEKDTVAVMNNEGKSKNKLSFNEEKGLLWPVSGNVIMNYSADKGIYFKTLGQYKCNPAIMIGSAVGSDVLCAAKGKVTDISTDEETGTTITTSIGNEYEVIYGQLKDVVVNKGDLIEEGQKIGLVAEPTKYYVLEGSNLYLKVLQNEESVNPLLLLR